MVAKRSDRLSIVESQELRPDSLVGSFFHSDADHGWQGCVVAEPSPGVYLVETFSWVVGESYAQLLVRIEDMAGWYFYDDVDWMNNMYQGSVKARWERQREEAKEGKT